MIKSMTSFGRASGIVDGKDILVEIKSVNNRYLDCNVKTPRMFSFLEEKIKAYVQTKGVARGKVDVFLGVDVIENLDTDILIDKAYAKKYIDALRELLTEFELKDDISVMTVAQNREIFSIKKPEEDIEKDWLSVKGILDVALDMFLEAREREGENLKNDLILKKQTLVALAGKVGEMSKKSVSEYEQKLEARLKQVLSENDIEMDKARILTECAIFADKVAIDEELVRLSSHFCAFDEMISSNGAVGRKLDFLVQEMNREINTIGSKACDIDIARTVIEMKSELEKIREQIQNIE